MRKICEDSLINLIRAIVVDRDDAKAREIVSTLASIKDEKNGETELSLLYKLAYKHQVHHFVDYARHLVDFSCAGDFYNSVSFTTQQVQAVKEISAAFSAAGIPHILLKGAVIRELYPERWMRNSCDIDVLVKEDELDKASDVLIGLGYNQHGGKGPHDIPFYKDVLHIELHYMLIQNFRMAGAAAILDNLWDVAVCGEGANNFAYTLPDDIFYFYHITHAAKHFGDGGCGVRSVIDTWILNNKIKFNKSARDALLKQGGLDRFEAAISRLAECWFGKGSGDGLEEIEKYILAGGVYGSREQKNTVRKVRRGKVTYILLRLFIPYKTLCRKYPVLKRHPYLYPVLHTWRWHEFFGKNRKKHARELRESFKNSDNISAMISELGLESFR